MYPFRFQQKIAFVTAYAIAHFAVDAACAFLFLGVIIRFSGNIILDMLLYNGFAFVLQAPFGLIIDKKLNPKLASILGLIFIATAFLFWNNIFIALVLIGAGNALYHVGGGSLILSLKKNKATFSGIYVAPGGIGLVLGTFLSQSNIGLYLFLIPLILLVLSVVLYFVKTPDFTRKIERESISNYGILLIVLIMIPIVVRSLIGLSIEFPWKENQSLYLTLITAIALGKVFGGVLADKFGLMKVGVGALLVSAPLLAFFPVVPILGILGGFVLNFTMPVTLIAIFNIIPKYKGLTFGLTTVALFIGSIPIIIGYDTWLKNELIVFTFILISAISFIIALTSNKRLKTINI